ncbi:unnamed protein product [Psylliodes chrysocephalus]|uniref:acid phosphatase n=1 Tax=Psylliodes chrysocephalus TaxID=3402493 RepID=A0A9P0CFG6_9CUCU|nr:unnamed protein product [Psylliodes chrysocephala]
MIFLGIVIFGIFLVGTIAIQDDSVAVVEVFRHGHRTPIVFYKTDPYADKSFWSGLDLGQLTNQGKREMYDLGQLTAQRYRQFLPQPYDKNNFYARCTDMDRTLMSGQCFLYGLFRSSSQQVWLKDSDWQPVPLHPADPKVFLGFPFPCPAYDNYHANAFKTEAFQKLDKENKDILEYVSKHTGDNYTTLFSTWLLYDCLRVELEAGYKLPDWVPPVYEKLQDIIGLLYQTTTGTTQAKRLYTGTFLNYVVDYFEKMASNSSYSQKFQVFSGHDTDTNIAAILNSFGAFDPPYPPAFASSIWIELKRNKGRYYVNVWSKDGSNLRQIKVNGCARNCPLHAFRKKLSDILLDPDTLTQECSDIS